MITAAVPVEASTASDPRLAAFLDPNCAEVFHSVATPTEIWKSDPFDVESIHDDARAAFEKLLHRGSREPRPPSGAVLPLLGEAGSGKTHLMRAFRTRTHGQGFGYCAYMQMTTEVNNYSRYILSHLIDCLDKPYDPDGTFRTGLARLSGALLEYVPNLSAHDLDGFRNGEGDATTKVDEFADRLYATARFRNCDLELLRTMLHLQRNEPAVHSRALIWLRCQEMRPQDRMWIGDAVARSDEADHLRMLKQLAKLVDAVHGVPLVLLIDQLEDMANQSAPVERFVKVIDAITAFTDTIPNAVVALACLEDYFRDNIAKLTKSKHDRLCHDPEPIRLAGQRTPDEIREMTIRRLAKLYDTAKVDVDPNDELYPFRAAFFETLNNMRARDALELLRRHHWRCMTEGSWRDPGETSVSQSPVNAETGLVSMWNDFYTNFAAVVPDDESELAGILADAVWAVSSELPDGYDFGPNVPDERYLEVEGHGPDNCVDRRLVAVCNANTRGTSFGKQIAELEKRSGEIPVAIVRTTDFPKSGKALTQVSSLIARGGVRVVAADADWRRMLAFEAFRKKHSTRNDFIPWQKSARPLGELPSLQMILNLKSVFDAKRPSGVMPIDRGKPADVSPSSEDPVSVTPPKTLGAPPTRDSVESAGLLLLGCTQGVLSTAVTVDPNELVMHAAFLGGAGSGKTTAALNLIEQLLVRGIPAVLVDRKGDLCRYADPTAWTRPLEDPKRVEDRKALRAMLDVAVFTPGEHSGRPLGLRVVPPAFDQLPEADREKLAQYAAGSLGSMIGFKSSDADKAQRAILAMAIQTLASVPGATITVTALKEIIEQRDAALLSAIGGGYAEKHFTKLAERLLTLELNNKSLLTGTEMLDIEALLGKGVHARPGRVQMSVISTRFLGDAAKVDFWVSQLLVAVSRFCAKSPQPRLQAVFLFDEADAYLPAGARQPATKAPMEDLLKRARSAGVGIFLATQSPGDLDYKCKENVRTWLIGRVKENRAIEKLKPMLAAAKTNVADKLGGQATGAFYLVREASVAAVRSNESLIRTEQLSEDEIATLARLAVKQ